MGQYIGSSDILGFSIPGHELVEEGHPSSPVKPRDLVGNAFIQPLPTVRLGYRCFAEVPRYLLSRLPWIDYSYRIEGLPSEQHGPPEKIVFRVHKDMEESIFCLFSLFDPDGQVSLDTLVGRNVVIRSAQWEEFEAPLTKTAEEQSDWMDFLYRFSARFRSARFPCFETMSARRFRSSSGDQLKIVVARPGISFSEETFLTAQSHLDTRTRVAVLPRTFIGLIESEEPSEESDMDLHVQAMFGPQQRGKSAEDSIGPMSVFVENKLAQVRPLVKRLGERFDEIVESLREVSKPTKTCIVTTVPRATDNGVVEAAIGIDHESTRVRSLDPSEPLRTVFDGEGESPVTWRMAGRDTLVVTAEELSSRLVRDLKPDLTIVMGSSRLCTESHFPGVILRVNALFREVPCVPAKCLSCDLISNGRVVFRGSSVERSYSFSLQELSSRP